MIWKWRRQRRASQRVLAEFAALHPSIVCRLEAGGDAKLSTWIGVFEALGCDLKFSVEEAIGWDDCEDYLLYTTDERYWKKLENLKR